MKGNKDSKVPLHNKEGFDFAKDILSSVLNTENHWPDS
jgi:hypothetical protein